MTPAPKEPRDRAVRLCLALCPGCQQDRQGGGACHLAQGHDGRHECNGVGKKVHRWE